MAGDKEQHEKDPLQFLEQFLDGIFPGLGASFTSLMTPAHADHPVASVADANKLVDGLDKNNPEGKAALEKVGAFIEAYSQYETEKGIKHDSDAMAKKFVAAVEYDDKGKPHLDLDKVEHMTGELAAKADAARAEPFVNRVASSGRGPAAVSSGESLEYQLIHNPEYQKIFLDHGDKNGRGEVDAAGVAAFKSFGEKNPQFKDAIHEIHNNVSFDAPVAAVASNSPAPLNEKPKPESHSVTSPSNSPSTYRPSAPPAPVVMNFHNVGADDVGNPHVGSGYHLMKLAEKNEGQAQGKTPNFYIDGSGKTVLEASNANIRFIRQDNAGQEAAVLVELKDGSPAQIAYMPTKSLANLIVKGDGNEISAMSFNIKSDGTNLAGMTVGVEGDGITAHGTGIVINGNDPTFYKQPTRDERIAHDDIARHQSHNEKVAHGHIAPRSYGGHLGADTHPVVTPMPPIPSLGGYGSNEPKHDFSHLDGAINKALVDAGKISGGTHIPDEQATGHGAVVASTPSAPANVQKSNSTALSA